MLLDGLLAGSLDHRSVAHFQIARLLPRGGENFRRRLPSAGNPTRRSLGRRAQCQKCETREYARGRDPSQIICRNIRNNCLCCFDSAHVILGNYRMRSSQRSHCTLGCWDNREHILLQQSHKSPRTGNRGSRGGTSAKPGTPDGRAIRTNLGGPTVASCSSCGHEENSQGQD